MNNTTETNYKSSSKERASGYQHFGTTWVANAPLSFGERLGVRLNMYKKGIFMLILLAMAACSSGTKDNAKKIEELKKKKTALLQQKTDIDVKLTDIQAQLKALGDSSQGKVETVSIMAPHACEFKHYIEVQGKVESEDNVIVSAKAAGEIVSLTVEPGDVVRKGQVLGKIDASIIEQSIEEIKTSLDLAKTVYDKQKNLWDQKIGTELQYLQAKSNLESLQKRMNTTNQQLDMYYIKSPIDGTVDEVMPKIGESVGPGTPVLHVVNYAKSKITAEVAESYISSVNKGDMAMIVFPDENKTISTPVDVVSHSINAADRTFKIELKPNGSDIELHPNMIAVVKINDYSNKTAMTLPVNLIQKDEEGTFVYVAVKTGKGFEAKKKMITTGISYGGNIEVNGLDANDQIINSGYENVVDGQAVAF